MSRYATKSYEAIRKVKEKEENRIRPEFSGDIDRIFAIQDIKL
ncbi:MAG: hypothetical protein ACK4YO_03310 [Candidatus Altarchaeaceae archaeon]